MWGSGGFHKIHVTIEEFLHNAGFFCRVLFLRQGPQTCGSSASAVQAGITGVFALPLILGRFLQCFYFYVCKPRRRSPLLCAHRHFPKCGLAILAATEPFLGDLRSQNPFPHNARCRLPFSHRWGMYSGVFQKQLSVWCHTAPMTNGACARLWFYFRCQGLNSGPRQC